ncbi:MAG: acyltransferase [Lachnospiraceae bacterium]|nr:acyltransferase [Lachnospiraceae bacterium]
MISKETGKLLRGIAILIVIASHYAEWVYMPVTYGFVYETIAKWGPVGVDVFLLMSGYGLHKSVTGGKYGKNNKNGITPAFVIKRLLGAYVPYLICRTLIYLYSGTWKEALAEGTMKEVMKDYFLGGGFWFMSVLFTMYIAFMIIYRFGGVLRVPLISAFVIFQTYYLYTKGYADFWELSNMAFVIGILAAAAEGRWKKQMSAAWYKVALAAISVAGICYTYNGMIHATPDVKPSYFAWELAFNIFFTLAVLVIAYIIPTWKGPVLTSIGESSLFVYLLHTAMFWALVFKFDKFGYAVATAITALITVAFATLLGLIYNRLSGLVTARL